MSCLDDDELSALVEGRLAPRVAEEHEHHLDICTICRRLVAALVRDLTTATDRGRRPAELAIGAMMGRYRILDWIGSGGMGVVYRAHDAELDRDVALKLLSSTTAGAWSHQAAELLRREARALARLAHPNVVAVYDAGSHAGEIYLVMELVAGLTLDRWLRVAPRDWRAIVRIFIEIGRGLAAVHEAGLVHGDLKPHNVLVGHDGRPRVVDFGLSRSDARSVPAGGTPRYMAPEQHGGGAADARSDQFSFCVALDEALAAVDPPAAVRRVVARGRRTQPTARYAGMSELLVELGATIGATIAAATGSRGFMIAAAATLVAGLAAVVAFAPAPITASKLSTEAERVRLESILRASVASGDVEDKKEKVFAAIRQAEIVGHDDAAALGWMTLSFLSGFEQRNEREGQRWADHAAASIQRGGNNLDLAVGLGKIEVMAAIAQGRHRIARTSAEALMARVAKERGPRDPIAASVHHLLALTLELTGERASAVDHLTIAVEIGEQSGDRELPNYLGGLGECLPVTQGVPVLERALRLINATPDADASEIHAARVNLAAAYRERGDREAAVALARQALSAAETADDHERIADARKLLGSVR